MKKTNQQFSEASRLLKLHRKEQVSKMCESAKTRISQLGKIQGDLGRMQEA